MFYQYFLNKRGFQAKPEVVLTPLAKAFNPHELCAVWYNFALIKLLPVPSVCRCFPAVSEATIMTLLLMTLEWFPLKLVQVHLHSSSGVKQKAGSVFPACSASCCHAKWAALTQDEQDVGTKSLLGHWQPLQRYFQAMPGEKRRPPNSLFPISLCSNIEAACVLWGMWGYIPQGHNTGWRLLRDKDGNMPVFCWEKQEYGSNVSCRRGDT